ncbi:MAG: cysteine desulfurase [Hyphomicrobiaceae bacterium]|jgi:cysteine desulfurase
MTESTTQRRSVYLDNHATTAVDPRVLQDMLPWFTERPGNAASRSHAWGWEAEEAVEAARTQVARGIGAQSKEVVFTSGATEADNLAIKGVTEFMADRGNHVVVAATEHKAVLDSVKALSKRGAIEITMVKPGRGGLIDPNDVAAAITDKTVLVSVMHANNEIGTIAPLADIGAACRQRGVFFHTDAAQSVGKVPVDVDAMNVDLLSISAHKLYGPKGVGALYVRARNPRVRLAPQMHGGGHERGMRSGTIDVPGVVGLGRAIEIAVSEMSEEAARTLALRESLRSQLELGLDGVGVNGDLAARLPGNLNLAFSWVDGQALMLGLRDIGLSSGSACSSATLEPSYVLRAIGLSSGLIHSSIRFGIGRFNTQADIDYVAERVITEVKRIREASGPGRHRGGASAVRSS